MGNKTRSEQAMIQLLELIKERGYREGKKLPNEYELSELLKVSRNTIREAVRGLSSRNILEIKQGAGTFISNKKGVADDPLGFSLVEDEGKLVQDLMEFRCIIEPQIALLASQNANDDDIFLLEKLCFEIDDIIDNGLDFTTKDIEFHTQLAKCSKNMVMSNLIPIICEGITVFSSAVAESEYIQTKKSHREIFEAVRDKRGRDAEQAMLFHLLYNKNRYIQQK